MLVLLHRQSQEAAQGTVNHTVIACSELYARCMHINTHTHTATYVADCYNSKKLAYSELVQLLKCTIALLFHVCVVLLWLQVVLCFSPVGSTLRVRARKFPALVNCTNIDWFHEWPEEALVSVSNRFLNMAESELLTVYVCFS